MDQPAAGLEGLLDRVEALADRERFADALATARQACTMAPGEAAAWEVRGEMALRSGLVAEAADARFRVTELEPGSAEAWFRLGEANQWREAGEDAAACFARAASLDPRQFVVPFRMRPNDFEVVAGSVLQGLPEQVVDFLESSGSAVVIRQLPSLAAVVDNHLDPHALGYCMGDVYGVAGGWGQTTPSEIEIYQLTIENWCADEAHLREEIRRTVLHEVGHAVGMDHEALHDDGYD